MKSNGEWELAIYKKQSIPICWQKDFNVSSKGLTIWKEKVTYQSRPLPQGKWSDSKLKLIKDNWYLCLTIEIDIPEPKTKGTIIGVDRGQKNILCAMDPKSNKTLYMKGKELNHKRLCIRQIRNKVVSVGTRSAYRLLKRLSGREKAVTQNILHIASKQLVTFAKSVGAKTIALEELTGFKNKQTKDNKKLHHKQRARNNRWAYAMLEFFINYKANFFGISVDHVPAEYTSQCCPKCGHISKYNRNGLKFKCIVCEYTDNADRIGAMNIANRMLLQRQAVEKRAIYQLAYSSHEGNCAIELQTANYLDGS